MVWRMGRVSGLPLAFFFAVKCKSVGKDGLRWVARTGSARWRILKV